MKKQIPSSIPENTATVDVKNSNRVFARQLGHCLNQQQLKEVAGGQNPEFSCETTRFPTLDGRCDL